MSATRKRKLKRAGLATIIAAIAALLIIAIAGGGKKLQVARTPKPPAATTSTSPTSTSPSADGPVLSAAEYRKRANAICNALPNPPEVGQTMQSAAPGLNRIGQELGELASRLETLKPPPVFAAQVAHALGLLRQEGQLASEMAAAASVNDQSNGRVYYEQYAGVVPQATTAWQQLGVPQC